MLNRGIKKHNQFISIINQCSYALFAQKPKTYYEILGVQNKSTPEDIKKAYFSLVKQYHPDHNKNIDAEDKFKEIVKAYETLKDPVKRQLYDFGSLASQDFNYKDAGYGFSAGGASTESTYYRQTHQRYYDNKWYGFQKPRQETQREEFEQFKQNFEKADQLVFFGVFRRAMILFLGYAIFDGYRVYSDRKHKELLNSQKELLESQLIVSNKKLQKYISERQEEWDLETQA